jgi:hypothetical protein
MGREMIDWDKPIETVGGRKARLVETHRQELWNIVFVPGGNFGDVFLVNDEGFCCGERTTFSTKREPFIRNVRAKREGWVVKYKDQDRLWDGHIYSSEKSAVDNSPVQTTVVRMQWEE